MFKACDWLINGGLITYRVMCKEGSASK